MSDKNKIAAECPYRQSLRTFLSVLCKEAGFQSVDTVALETLLEMMQSFITELGRSSRAFAELGQRTNVAPPDVATALVEMGFSVEKLLTMKHSKFIVPPPSTASSSAPPKSLAVGKIKSHPAHIPQFLPPFPDPHTYVKTPVKAEIPSDYAAYRETAATQQKNLEMSLGSFLTQLDLKSYRLMCGDKTIMITSPRCDVKPYLSALLPPANLDLDVEETTEAIDGESAEMGGTGDNSKISGLNIDNPYLKAPKLPKLFNKT